MPGRLPVSAAGDTRVRLRILLDRVLNRFAGFPWAPVVIALAALAVIVRLPTHFWLDETMSYWTASHGFQQILVRCALWPHPVAYSLVFLAIRSLGITSEWVYRLPSFLALCGCACLLFRISRRLFGSEAAWMSTAIFVLIAPVRFAAGDARPYGLALLFAMIASELLLRFLSRPGYRLAVLYGLSAAAMLYLQILFGAVLVVHVLYVGHLVARGRRFRLSYVLAGAALLAALAAPQAIQFLRFTGNASSHSFAARPALNDLAMSFAPDFLLYVLEAIAALALLLHGVQWQMAEESGASVLVILWTLVPPIILFAISRLSAAHIFVTRYYLTYTPGLAMCFGLMLVSFRPRILRAAALSLLAVFAAWAVISPRPIRHTDGMGDWADAAKYVNANVAQDHAPVLIRSELVESDSMPILPIEDNGNFAQLSFYPMNAALTPLRNTFTAEQAAAIHDFIQNLPRGTQRFLLISVAGPAPLPPFLREIRDDLGPGGTMTQLADFDGLTVTEFRVPRR